MLDPMPSAIDSPFGFQACENVSELNQNHPMMEMPATGMITPQTVIAPMRPVMLGPPKFANVVSQSRTISPMQVAMGVAESHGKKPAR